MKRILNLNDFSLLALKTIFITGWVLPAVLFLFSHLLDHIGLHLPLLTHYMPLNIFAGCVGKNPPRRVSERICTPVRWMKIIFDGENDDV